MPQSSIVNIRNFSLNAAEWTPIAVQGRILGVLRRAWFDFSADVKVRSDPGDSNTEATLLVANGGQFVIPVMGDALKTPVFFYAQSVTGDQVVRLTWIAV